MCIRDSPDILELIQRRVERIRGRLQLVPRHGRGQTAGTGNCSWLLNTHVLARHHRPPYRTSPSSQKRRLGSCGGTRTGFDGRQKGVSPKKGRHGENFGGAGRRHMTCRGLPPRRRQPKYVSSLTTDAQQRSYVIICSLGRYFLSSSPVGLSSVCPLIHSHLASFDQAKPSPLVWRNRDQLWSRRRQLFIYDGRPKQRK